MTFNTSVLRHARELRGWSQAQVAREVGTDARSVGRWERGVTRPSSYFRQQLCQLFALDAEALGLLESPLATSSSPMWPVSPVSLPVLGIQTPREPLLDPARPSLPPSQMIERPVFLEQVFMHLMTGTACVLYGLPGVGKTTLVQQLSLHPSCQERFPDGLLWIRLGQTPQVQHELRRLGALLHIPEVVCREVHETDALSHLLHLALDERRILLVIDDAWHTQDVQPFLVGGQHTAYVITTRLPEVAFALTRGTPLAVPELTGKQSQHLLQSLVPQLAGDVEHQEQFSALHQAAGGLPLALMLIGHLLRRQLIGGQARRVQTVLTSLAAGLSTMPTIFTTPVEGTASLDTLLSLSEQPLSPVARQSLRALAVLPAKPASFSEAAALVICACEVEALDELLNAGLLEGAGEGRYQIHQVIAGYARLHLSDETPWRRLLTYALDSSQDRAHTMPLLLQDWAVLEAAWQVACEKGWKEELLQLSLHLHSVWRARGVHRLALQRLQLVRPLAQEHDQPVRLCQVLGALFSHAQALGDLEQASGIATALLRLAQQHDIVIEQARAFNQLGIVAEFTGNLQEADRYFQSILALAGMGASPLPRLATFNNRGEVLFHQGLFQEAEVCWQEGLALSQEHKKDWQWVLLSNVAWLYLFWSDQIEKAEAALPIARTLAEELQDAFALSMVALRQAQVAWRRGAYEACEQYLHDAQQKVEQSNHLELSHHVWIESAALLVALGHLARAEECLQRLAPWSSLLGIHRHLRVKEQVVWGEVRLAQQRPAEAMQHFQIAEQMRPPLYRLLYLQVLYGLARASAALGRKEEAYDLGQECLAAMRQCDYWQVSEVQTWLEQLTSSAMSHEVINAPITLSHEVVSPSCPQCQSQHVVRRGKNRRGEQRYHCLTCQRAFTPFPRRVVPTHQTLLREQAQRLTAQGKSLRAIARELQVHHETVRRWLSVTEAH